MLSEKKNLRLIYGLYEYQFQSIRIVSQVFRSQYTAFLPYGDFYKHAFQLEIWVKLTEDARNSKRGLLTHCTLCLR